MTRLSEGDDQKILEDLRIVQGTVIHLQDARLLNKAKYNKGEIDWTKLIKSGLGESAEELSLNG
jgi:hypothetical protein